jgi:hypothetical protein
MEDLLRFGGELVSARVLDVDRHTICNDLESTGLVCHTHERSPSVMNRLCWFCLLQELEQHVAAAGAVS